jgi:hypothetical protein
MNWRLITWSGLGAVALFVAIGGAWILSLPAAPTITAAPPIAKEEADATLTALKAPKRQRPLIAIQLVKVWAAKPLKSIPVTLGGIPKSPSDSGIIQDHGPMKSVR